MDFVSLVEIYTGKCLFGDGMGNLATGTKCMDNECMLPPRSVDHTIATSEMDSARTVENSTFYKVADRT